jgi:hypothetical protein
MAHIKKEKTRELACCDEDTMQCEACELEEFLEKAKENK